MVTLTRRWERSLLPGFVPVYATLVCTIAHDRQTYRQVDNNSECNREYVFGDSIRSRILANWDVKPREERNAQENIRAMV